MRYVLADNALDDLITDLYEFRRTIKEKEGKSEMRQAVEECQIKKVRNERLNIINCIKRKHERTLKEYGFLSDVIQIFCPLLFQNYHIENLCLYFKKSIDFQMDKIG